MATIAIGDIHGNLAALTDLLDQLTREAARGDAVVFLGDYVDRGRDSKKCIDAILSFRSTIAAEVVCLMVNHEEWLLRSQRDHASHSWLLGMGALDTIESYSPKAASGLRAAAAEAGLQLYLGKCELPYGLFFDALPPDHRAFFDQLMLSFESADCICTHAGLDPAIADLKQQPSEALVWGHPRFPKDYTGEKVVVYGHWDNAEGSDNGRPAPRVIGKTIGIDTISHGVLTAVRLPDRRIFQSAATR